MSNRKIPTEIQEIFDRHITGFARRLKRPAAVKMLMEEFGLNEDEAGIMFEVFDKDSNQELSLWEFQQFYTCIGQDAKNTFMLFEKLEKEQSGTVDIEKCWDMMKSMKTHNGKNLEENDIEMLIKATAGQDKCIDLKKFINLTTRVKFFK